MFGRNRVNGINLIASQLTAYTFASNVIILGLARRLFTGKIILTLYCPDPRSRPYPSHLNGSYRNPKRS